VKIHLRDNGPDDFDTLIEIDRACYEPGIAYSKRDMRAYLQFPGAECILAESAGEIAGFCINAVAATSSPSMSSKNIENPESARPCYAKWNADSPPMACAK